MEVVLHTANAKLPQRSTLGSVGYDLSSSEDTIIQPNSLGCVPTGLSIKVPEGTYGRIAPRSGLAVRHNIDVFAGVIDPDYTGEVRVCLYNHGKQPFTITSGDRIAQL